MRNLTGKSVTVDMRNSGLGLFEGTIKRITPTASTQLTHPGLAAKFGGSIDILERRVKNRGNTTGESLAMEFFRPRFAMEIQVPDELVQRLWAGQLAYIRAEGARVSMQTLAGQLFYDWLKKKNQAAGIR